MTANKEVFTQNCIFASSNGCLYSITIDDKNIWACGEVYGNPWDRPLIVCIDKDSRKITTQKHILTPGEGCLDSIARDSNGNIWMCGSIYERPFCNPIFLVIDKNTKKMIQKRVLLPFDGLLKSIALNDDNEVWMCGCIDNNSHIEPFFVVLNKDTKGVITRRCIPTPSAGNLKSITADSDGNMWMCGYIYVNGYDKPLIIVVDKDTKEVVIQKYISVPTRGYLNSITEGPDGNIWVCGEVLEGSYTRPFIVCIDKNTKEISIQRCITTFGDGKVCFIAKDFDKNIRAYGFLGNKPFSFFISKDIKEMSIQRYVLSNGGCLHSAILDGNSMWMCGGVGIDSGEKPFVMDIDLTDTLNTYPFIEEISFRFEENCYTVETNYTTEDITSRLVVSINYPIETTSYVIKTLE